MRKQLLLIAVLIGLGYAAVAQSVNMNKTVPKGTNIAKGKKYTFSAQPTTKWKKYLKQSPQYDKILTDGEIERSSSGSFWVSSKCANFVGTASVDVIIDLGREMPVSGIFTRHGARPNAGVCMPKKEEYYLSDDGNKFYKAGVFYNTFDDYSIKKQLEIKKKFTRGTKVYGIDNLKAKGRYVLVRTYGSGVGGGFKTYVGYDEIFVIKGNFALSSAKRNHEDYINLKKLDLHENILGYRVNIPDWQKIVKEQPVYLALAPTQFLGDNDYHLSVGGTYVLQFKAKLNTDKPVTDLKVQCEMPASVELISHHNRSELTSRAAVKKSGQDYMKYTFSITNPEKSLTLPMYNLFMMVRSKSTNPGNAGKGYYSYSYKVEGKAYNSSNSFNIIVDKRIIGVKPKRFITGFWYPYQARFLDDKANAEASIMKFYSSLGFNCQNGGNRSRLGYDAAHKNKIKVYGGSGYDNALMIARMTIPEDEQFMYHSTQKNNHKGRPGVCPTLMLCSDKYSSALKDKFKEALAEVDHVYSNWEPYMYMKRGCVCDRCKNEFQKFSKIDDAKLNKLWPDCTIDYDNELHNRFSSYRYAELVKQAQRLTREAGRELKLKHKPNFMIAYEPSFVNPDKSWFKVHNHGLFYKDIDMTIMWHYPNTVVLDAFDLKIIPGNSLKSLPGDFVNAQNTVNKYGHGKSSKMYPKMLFMGTEYSFNMLVMPKDYYFMSLLCFFSGLDGYGTWCTSFKCDARYTALNAKANTLISKLEDIVLDGEKVNNAKVNIISPVPKGVKLVTVKSFKLNAKELVAIGNDHIATVYVKLQIKGITGDNIKLYDRASMKVFQKSPRSGYSAGELAKGVVIPIAGKSWTALQIGSIPAEADKYKVYAMNTVKKQLKKDIAGLKQVISDLR